jgi:hypothetical protein
MLVWLREGNKKGRRPNMESGMLRSANHVWTLEDEARLRGMATEGLFLRNIALRLKRSESSIKKRVHDLGITLKKPPRHRFRFDELTKAQL